MQMIVENLVWENFKIHLSWSVWQISLWHRGSNNAWVTAEVFRKWVPIRQENGMLEHKRLVAAWLKMCTPSPSAAAYACLHLILPIICHHKIKELSVVWSICARRISDTLHVGENRKNCPGGGRMPWEVLLWHRSLFMYEYTELSI